MKSENGISLVAHWYLQFSFGCRLEKPAMRRNSLKFRKQKMERTFRSNSVHCQIIEKMKRDENVKFCRFCRDIVNLALGHMWDAPYLLVWNIRAKNEEHKNNESHTCCFFFACSRHPLIFWVRQLQTLYSELGLFC